MDAAVGKAVMRHPHGGVGGRIKKTARRGAVVGSVTGLLVLGLAGIADAHTGTLNVSPECVNGQQVLTFSGATSSVPETGPGHTATFSVGEVQPAGATVSDAPTQVVGNAPYSFKLTVPGDTTYAQATAFLEWGDGVKADPQGKINLPGNCTPPKHDVTPAAPTATTPTCDQPNITVTPPKQEGVVATPAEPFTLTPGQSQTVHLAPADGWQFPAGTQVDYPFTNSFHPEDCTPPNTVITAIAPTTTTPDCNNPNMVVTPSSQEGVIATPAQPFTLAPGETGVVDYVAAPLFEFVQGQQTHWSFTNDFNVKDCDTPPPAVLAPKGNVQTDCTHKVTYYLNNLGSTKGQAAPYRLTLGNKSWAVKVPGGKARTITRHGKPGQVGSLFVAGHKLGSVKVKGDCHPTPPPVCKHNCTPPPVPPTHFPDTGYTASVPSTVMSFGSASAAPTSFWGQLQANLGYALAGLCLMGAFMAPAVGKLRTRKRGVR